jgi:type II secretory pathway component PulL
MPRDKSSGLALLLNVSPPSLSHHPSPSATQLAFPAPKIIACQVHLPLQKRNNHKSAQAFDYQQSTTTTPKSSQ